MQYIIKFLFCLIMGSCISLSGIAWSQNINGTAYYKSHRKMDFKMNDEKMNDAMKAQMQAMLEKQFQKEYKLVFNSNESLYEEEKNLDSGPTSMNAGGMEMVFSFSGGSDILYKNLVENRYVNHNDFHGKLFLIEGMMEKPKWTLTKETKQIGEYVCFKATFERAITKTVLTSEDGENEENTFEEQQTVTAWYTPQIPVSNGPGNYWGLPGLILEVNDGSESLLCTKLILNNKETVEINKPKKGKKISQDAYDKIVKEKNEELRERFQGNRKGDGSSFEFRIGG